MNNIILRKINPDNSDITEIVKINDEAFPEYERISVRDMMSLSSETDLLGIYYNNKICGFMLLVKGEYCAYLYYFAIDKNYRGQGIGKESLKLLRSIYNEYQIVLDFEEILESSENYSQRVKRKNFYLSNGFKETGRFTFIDENRFEVVCSDSELNLIDFRKIISVIHSKIPSFLDKLD